MRRQDGPEEQDRAARAVGVDRLVAHDADHPRRHERVAAQVERERLIPRVGCHGVDRAVTEWPPTAAGRREDGIDATETLDHLG
jgi:hypothetical protein